MARHALCVLLAVLAVVVMSDAAATARGSSAAAVGDDIPNFTNVQLWECKGGKRQQWAMTTSGYPNNNIFLKQDTNMVLDILGWGNSSGTNLQVKQ